MIEHFLILAIPIVLALYGLHRFERWDNERIKRQIQTDVQSDATRRVIKKQLEQSV